MSHTFETDFIHEAKERTPFAESAARNFFGEWCKLNDSIVPAFMPRAEWELQRTHGILEKNDENKQTLFLPEDLRLWEMMDIIRTVDQDTLARHPARRDQRADQVRALGETFRNAGRYLKEYVPHIAEGNAIAAELAQEFYDYGLSLEKSCRTAGTIPKKKKLSAEEKQQLDEWFLGQTVY